MQYVQYLVAQGVSQSGAVEVVLGRSITLSADRAVLAKLQVPAPIERVKQAKAPAQPITMRSARSLSAGMIQLPSAGALLASLVTGRESGWDQVSAVLGRLLAEAGAGSRKSEIDALKQQLQLLKQKKKALLTQLFNLLGHPPPSSAPAAVKNAWQASIQQLQQTLAELEMELVALLNKITALSA
jgi:hypothetical protein